MKEQAKCPICGKRLFDIEQYLIGNMEIKCLQCRQIVRFAFTPELIKSKCEAQANISNRAKLEAK